MTLHLGILVLICYSKGKNNESLNNYKYVIQQSPISNKQPPQIGVYVLFVVVEIIQNIQKWSAVSN
jgi:hypothetical protein